MIDSKKIEITDLEAFKQWVSSFINELGSEKHLILLCGKMGVGKTQWVKEALATLGSTEASSPSFAIHNAYETDHGSVDHVDLYRLESEDDLESTGFWDLFGKSSGYIFVEWADRLPLDCFPLNWPMTKIVIVGTGPTSRNVFIENYR